MRHILGAAHLKQRFALWVLEKTLPDVSSLRPKLHAAMLGIAAAAFGGVLLAITVVTALIGIYALLWNEGWTATLILPVIGAVSFLLSCAAFLVSRYALQKSVDLSPSHNVIQDSDLADACTAIIQGFLDGLLKKNP